MELIKIFEKNLIFLLLLFFSGCTDPSPDSSVQAKVDSEHPGMILVEATGESTTLGSNDASAPFNAKPAMKVKFTYDFSLSKSEVTRSEYAALMEKKSSIASDSANLPQTNVTYYDAVLYANARSVSENHDTAYSYSSAIFDSEGNCTNLNGLVFDPSKEAYRPPQNQNGCLRQGKAGTPPVRGRMGTLNTTATPFAPSEKMTWVSATWRGTQWNG